MKLFWHVIEVCLIILGYMVLWTVAGDLVNAPNDISVIMGWLLYAVLVANLVVIGNAVLWMIL